MEIAKQCDSGSLKQILCEEMDFGQNYRIDEETIPKLVSTNPKDIVSLHEHLTAVNTEPIYIEHSLYTFDCHCAITFLRTDL